MSRKHTLLSKLGFSDKDRSLPLHDLGCQYLSLPRNAARLYRVLYPEAKVTFTYDTGKTVYNGGWCEPVYEEKVISVGSDDISFQTQAEVELLLNKGTGKYRTTIGFVDLVLRIVGKGAEAFRYDGRQDLRSKEGFHMCCGQLLDRDGGPLGWWPAPALVVEVKAGNFNTMDAVRQLKLYREYLQDSHSATRLVLATVQPVSNSDKRALRDNDILHIRLAKPFLDWVEVQREAEASPDIEF